MAVGGLYLGSALLSLHTNRALWFTLPRRRARARVSSIAKNGRPPSTVHRPAPIPVAMETKQVETFKEPASVLTAPAGYLFRHVLHHSPHARNENRQNIDSLSLSPRGKQQGSGSSQTPISLSRRAHRIGSHYGFAKESGSAHMGASPRSVPTALFAFHFSAAFRCLVPETSARGRARR